MSKPDTPHKPNRDKLSALFHIKHSQSQSTLVSKTVFLLLLMLSGASTPPKTFSVPFPFPAQQCTLGRLVYVRLFSQGSSSSTSHTDTVPADEQLTELVVPFVGCDG